MKDTARRTQIEPESMHKYVVVFLVSGIFFIIFSMYLYLRRGFYDLYIINKILAGVAATQLGAVLLLGSLARMFNRFDVLLQFRKHLGILSFITALLHSLISFFFLRDHFPLEKYIGHINIPFVFGLLAIIILTILFVISNDKVRRIISPQRWWKIQYIGVRVAFIAVILHVVLMKYQGWISWYQKGGSNELVHPEWPGLGMLIGFFVLYVLALKIAERISKSLGTYFIYLGTPALILMYMFTFIWGQMFFLGR